MKLFPHSRSARRALTALDVFLIIATLALLAIVVLPRLARSKVRVSRLGCTSNLKLVSLAFRMYSNDQEDRFPFAVSDELGGTLKFVNSPEVIRHFQSLSNELVTPKILVCPNDSGRLRASDFLSPLANSNLSYFAGLDAEESKTNRFLSGDRNITGGTLSNGFLRSLPRNAAAGWTTELHNNAGNIGLSDGSVQQLMPASLQKQLQAQDLPVIRLAIP